MAQPQRGNQKFSRFYNGPIEVKSTGFGIELVSFRQIREEKLMVKKGFALGIVVVFIAFFMIMVFAVMRFSRSEMRSTSQMALQKKAQMLALSGINIAEMALEKGRWYQPPYKPAEDINGDGETTRAEAETSSLISRPNFSYLDISPKDGEDGTIKIYFQEIAKNGVDVSNNRLYAKYKLKTADLLDHIKVYSVGEFQGERVMMYGKFIMSPSPLFNSPTMDIASHTEFPTTEFHIICEPPRLVKEQIDQGMQPFKIGEIKEVLAKAGDRVDPNTRLLVIKDAEVHDPGPNAWISTQLAQPKSQAHGVVKSMINPNTGSPWRVGDQTPLPIEVAIISEDSNVGSDIPSQTLKKMAMIMEIPPSLYSASNLTANAATYNTLNKIGSYTRGVAIKFVMNSMNKGDFQANLETVFKSAFPAHDDGGTNVSKETIISTLDSIGTLDGTDYNFSGNKFIISMLKKWRPRGFKMTPDEMENIADLASFSLGVKETDPRKSCQDIFTICQEFSEWVYDTSATPLDKNWTPEELFAIWHPRYPGADGLPSQYPLRTTWDYFEKTLAREIKQRLYPSVPLGANTTPPYVISPANSKKPTDEYLKFKGFKGRYAEFANKSDGGFDQFMESSTPEEFVQKMSILKNAAKKVHFTFLRWIPWQDWDYSAMVNDYAHDLNGLPKAALYTHDDYRAVVGFKPDNYWPWWGDQQQLDKRESLFKFDAAKQKYPQSNNTFGAKGWPDQLRMPKGDPSGSRINPSFIDPKAMVEQVDVPYTYDLKFKSGKGIKTRMDYLLDYFRKYFDEPPPKPSATELRGASDQTDTPQTPGPPDLLGAIYTGLSS
ncbi:MAG: hypothetical protein KKB51_06145 [Candidatus Riflebacteria bacterium]|nr:hypothetical protein [Candidatus Riflebacteria bacterium]